MKYDENFKELEDLLRIKTKWKNQMVTCIEMEIYPHIDEKLSKKLTDRMEKKIQSL